MIPMCKGLVNKYIRRKGCLYSRMKRWGEVKLKEVTDFDMCCHMALALYHHFSLYCYYRNPGILFIVVLQLFAFMESSGYSPRVIAS